jgi:hypothetical protein
MTFTRLVIRSAAYHWRTNLAVIFGVAAAVAVLGGALIVGDSVRGSLRDLALSRLGSTGSAVSSAGFFREELAADLGAQLNIATAPLLAVGGFVTHEPSGRRASSVHVYGVDERFWRFHGQEPREGVFVSPALAAELDAQAGDVLLTRLQKPSEIPLESLFAQKEDIARSVRLTVAGVLAREQLGEFSLEPQQNDVRAVFAPLRRLQRDLAAAGRANTVLVAAGPAEADVDRALGAAVTLEDLAVRVDASADSSAVMVSSASGIVSDPLREAVVSAAKALALEPMPVFTYLANSIRMGDRTIPYSLITGLDLDAVPATGAGGVRQQASDSADAAATTAPAVRGVEDAIVLNDWAARELQGEPGDRVEVEFYLWDAAAGLRTSTASFTLRGIVPVEGLAADRRLAPEYPGITSADSLADWDPPFPLDLSRIRKQDEEYWDRYRTTPKAFIEYARARDLWSTRYGRLTGLRFTPGPGRDAAQVAATLRDRLRETVPPASQGLLLTPSRRLALEASTGATNFAEYFTYFSFFIVVSALLLTLLFFRLGVEGRLRQVGILRATGFTVAHIRRLLLLEGIALAVAGSVIGAACAVAYARFIVYGLTTWWIGAVGTRLLDVHVGVPSLLAGAAGGTVTAAACVLLSLRSVSRRSPRALLGAQSLDGPAGADPRRSRRSGRLAAALALLGLCLLTLGFVSPATQAGAFFGAGAALLMAFLLFLSSWLRARDTRAVSGRGVPALARLGFRGAAFRPARSVLSAALVASATFILVSVDAFRRGGEELTNDPRSGTGGYALLAQSEIPIVHNPDAPAGREALLMDAPALAGVRFTRFRMRPGEDASCLNLYRPGTPAIVSPEQDFIDSGRFTFAASLAASDAERANPWLLLRRPADDGAVPVVADATSLQYVLHASVGDTMSMDVGSTEPVVVRFVGALRDSVLQGELIMGEEHFVRLFPGQEGFRFFLIAGPGVTTREQASQLARAIEEALEPFGVDAVSTVERLDAFHRVENTYLSTFQALGGLGLLLGTIGLATVMFRNVLERRRELALLRAVGYDARHVSLMILAETAFLLGSGVLAGAACALLAIAPAWLERGSAPGLGLPALLAAVVLAGLLSAAAATRAAVRGELLQALRAE